MLVALEACFIYLFIVDFCSLLRVLQKVILLEKTALACSGTAVNLPFLLDGISILYDLLV